jgi:low temperature requirement protein LtrA
MTGSTVGRFRAWFWRPPRPHGATVRDRSVTSLELLYDLVFVAVISQAGRALAEDVTGRGIAEFAVVFSMIWIAWINGSLYVELHGRQDGRTRSVVFIQIAILALLAVFTDGAAGPDGTAFAIVYAALLAMLCALWYSVRLQDDPEFLPGSSGYVAGTAISVVVVLVSAFLPDDARLVVWAGYSLGWIVGMKAVAYRSATFERALAPTESMVERFGLFTIIVLGEVVFGVVDGMSHAVQDWLTIATGLLALVIGFGFWWMYFDTVGRRLPRADSPAIVTWMISHLPITLSIAAAGPATVSLIEHAHDASVPATTSWLLGGAVAVGLLGIIANASALADAERLPAVYRPLAASMAIGAVAALGVAWLRPPPWALALSLDAILVGLWLVTVARFLQAGAWIEAPYESEPRGGSLPARPDAR